MEDSTLQMDVYFQIGNGPLHEDGNFIKLLNITHTHTHTVPKVKSVIIVE